MKWPFRRRRGTTQLIPADSTRFGLEQYMQLMQQAGFGYAGGYYPLGNQQVATTYAPNPVEPIPNSLTGYAIGGLFSNSVVAGLEWTRLNIFSEVRFQWQQLRNGRPGDLFGTPGLAQLENPWVGGTTGDLLTRLLLDADLVGNAYWARIESELVRLRPDWVEIVVAPRMARIGRNDPTMRQVGWRRVGYAYYEGGKGETGEPALFLADQVVHFAPLPDPLATYRGMSWLTPAVREVQADGQATTHKQSWWENAASPNLAVSLKEAVGVEQFRAFVDAMDAAHKGADKAGKTLYLGGGADVTVIGRDMQQADYSNIIGKGETRIALAAGIHPVVAGLSEGMQGAALNAGNYGVAKRSTGDKTFRPLWRNVAGSLQVLFPPPPGSRLWYDARDVAFLRDDAQDLAKIQQSEATTIRTLIDGGFTADSVTAAVIANDWSLLEHSGFLSVQLQPLGAIEQPPVDADVEDADVEGDTD